jgi:metallo-beta-lactamase family protein
MQLTFYGGTGEATGSNYILESGGTRIMIDCGLHQGSHYADRENFEPFAYDPKSVTAVFITHSHLDHIGRLPSLVLAGFKGAIYSTHATRDFATLMLEDSEHLLAKEAEREARPPLYIDKDIPKVTALWKGLKYHEPIEVGPFKVELYDAGHILGSAIIHVECEGKTIVFSGDLGNVPSPLIKPRARGHLAPPRDAAGRDRRDVCPRRRAHDPFVRDGAHAGPALSFSSTV